VKKIYCHFSFRRKKGTEECLFAVAFYDINNKLVTYRVKADKIWEQNQFICAIQSYEYALSVIQEWQSSLIKNDIGKVLLVSDNSTLVGWILDHKKNVKYTKYMEMAVKNYRANAIKEIAIGVGVCEAQKYEKSYKYCNDQCITDENTNIVTDGSSNMLNIKSESILDIVNSNKEIEVVIK